MVLGDRGDVGDVRAFSDLLRRPKIEGVRVGGNDDASRQDDDD